MSGKYYIKVYTIHSLQNVQLVHFTDFFFRKEVQMGGKNPLSTLFSTHGT